MRIRAASLFCVVVFIQGVARAQTLQLPTFSSFATSTSVLVPDRGAATLGSVARAGVGGAQSGPHRGTRAAGADRGGSQARVSAFMHDLETMDRDRLQSAAARRGDTPAGRSLKQRGEANGPLLSVAEIRRRRAATETMSRDDAAAYLQRGKLALAAGKRGVAKLYFQMAERRAAGAAQLLARAELARLLRKPPAPAR